MHHQLEFGNLASYYFVRFNNIGVISHLRPSHYSIITKPTDWAATWSFRSHSNCPGTQSPDSSQSLEINVFRSGNIFPVIALNTHQLGNSSTAATDTKTAAAISYVSESVVWHKHCRRQSVYSGFRWHHRRHYYHRRHSFRRGSVGIQSIWSQPPYAEQSNGR